MAIKIGTIIQKMRQELDQAMKYDADDKQITNHITKIHLLCELILEDSLESSKEGKEKRIDIHENQQSTDHGDANGSSIFDF